jgi:NADPH-dependent 2,4-dienoyl-CoA reductase/sulfur reductase-like enzyme
MPETPESQKHRDHALSALCRPRHCAGMSERLSAEVCVVGAGPVGGTLACRLAATGVATTAKLLAEPKA